METARGDGYAPVWGTPLMMIMMMMVTLIFDFFQLLPCMYAMESSVDLVIFNATFLRSMQVKELRNLLGPNIW